jgi:hypothetical protein
VQFGTCQKPLKATVLDPTHLKLSSPLPLGKGQVVYVAFLQAETEKDESRQWQDASRTALAQAYDANEPDYNAAMVKESNSDYQA